MRAIALLVGAALLAGCSQGDRAPVGRVGGTVKFQGQPIKAGTIIFEVPGARPANGKIVDGQITEVTTYEPGDGVPVGQAKIAVFATDTGAAASAVTTGNPGTGPSMGANYMGGGASSLIPEKYNNPASSELNWEIKPGDNQIQLDLNG